VAVAVEDTAVFTNAWISKQLQRLDGVVRDNYRHQATTVAPYVDQLIVLKHLLLHYRQLLLIHVPLAASSQSPTAIVDGSLPLLALNSVSRHRTRSRNSVKRPADHIENVSLASSAMQRTVYSGK